MKYIQDSKIVVLTEPGAALDNAAEAVAAVDTKGFDQLDIYVILGATDIALTQFKLRQADDNATYTDVPGSDYSDPTNGTTLPSATDDNHNFAWHVDLLGKQRFQKPSITIGAGSAGAFIVVIAILSRAKQSCYTPAQRGVTQDVFV